MSDRIPALLEPIQHRLNAATPGPWFAHQDYIDMGVPDASQTITTSKGKYDGRFVANAGLHPDVKDANAALIANAPTDQARLLAAVQAGTSILDERARELRKTADRLNQQVIDRDPDRDIEAAQRYSHYAAQAEAAAYAHRAAVVAALGGEA